MSVETQNPAVADIVRLVIDHPDLQQYLHEDIPGRKPLVLVVPIDPKRLGELHKFQEKVVVLGARPAGDAPHFEITSLSVSGDRAHVEFLYPVEGVSGSADFSRTGDRWSVDDFDIWES